MWNLKPNPIQTQRYRYKEQTGGCQRWGMVETVEGGPKAQMPKLSKKYRRCHIQYSDWSSGYCLAYLKVAQRVDLKSSHHKKRICNYVRGWMLTKHNHFLRYINIKSLCCTA